MLLYLFQLLAGFVLLYFGAEGLVRGSSSMALRLRVSPLVIGLTVVAYGTSMPELVVSVKAALAHQGDVSIGNVIGSNIFNIAVILGLSALIYPLKVKVQVIRYDAPIALFASILFLFFFRDNVIGRWEGAFFVFLILLYTVANLYFSRKAGRQAAEEFADTLGVAPLPKPALEAALILLGLAALVLGADLLVKGAVGTARLLHVSEAVIALTIISAGTSLPELATSTVAALRRESDIAVGNIIGSNIFNLLSILGTAALLSPIEGEGIRALDGWMMVGLSLLIVPVMRTRFRISRWEGALLLAIYAGYLALLLGR